jgi:hypothetical protein
MSEEKKSFLNDCWVFDSKTNIWTEILLSGIIPSPRGGHCISYIGNGFIILHGGFEKKTYDDCYSVDLKNSKSQILNFSKKIQIPSATKYATSLYLNSNFILICGKGDKKNLNEIWALDCNQLKFKYLMKNVSKFMDPLEALEKNPTNKKEKKQYNAVKLKSKGNVQIKILPKLNNLKGMVSPRLITVESDQNETKMEEEMKSVQLEEAKLTVEEIQEKRRSMRLNKVNSKSSESIQFEDIEDFTFLPQFKFWKKYVNFDTKSDEPSQLEIAKKEVIELYNVEKKIFV